MRDHVAVCLRHLTGCEGRFSDELEAFWRDVERQYKCCNVQMIPQDHIPLWHAVSAERGIPVEAPPPKPLHPAEERSVEARLRKATTV